MRVPTSTRLRVATLAGLVALAITAGLAISVAGTSASDSTIPRPAAEQPARSPDAVEPAAATDASPNPWEMNDPDWGLEFLGTYCPWNPLPAPEPEEIVDAVRACTAQRSGALDNLAAPHL